MSKKIFLPTVFKRPLGLLFLVLCYSGFAGAQDLASISPVVLTEVAADPGEAQQHTMPLEAFMRQIQREYGIYFSYQVDSLKETIVLSGDPDKKKEPDPDKLLTSVLTPAGLTYEKVNNVYIITLSLEKKKALKKKEPQPASLTVTGKESDNNGPMPGATVTEKGKSTATTTDAHANFQLPVSGPKAILIFSYVGYKTIEVPLNSQTNITVSLEAGQSQDLSGVVVTALGITRTKRSLGYAVGEIKGDDVNKVSQTNVLNGMAGKVSGVAISATGASPTSSVSMVIRGIRSLNTDNH